MVLLAHPKLRLLSGAHLAEPEGVGCAWGWEALAGRFGELSSAGASAALTVAFGLVLEAQREGAPAGWLAAGEDLFFPPDAALGGVDLEALAVVRCGGAAVAARAADRLARSGAFGLLVIDLCARRDPRGGEIPLALQARLVKLAQQHDLLVLCLSLKDPELPSLSSLVSFRAQAELRPGAEGLFSCEVRVLKDKRRGPGWRHQEVCRGAPGLC